MLLSNGTTVDIYAPDKNVSGLHADNYRINLRLEVD
jgi:hypothetical protein